MLSGSLAEIRFAWPDESEAQNTENSDDGDDECLNHHELKELSRNSLNVNDVAYING